MATHVLPVAAGSLHGYFSRDISPILEIDSGDTVVFETLDGDWLTGLTPPPQAGHGQEWPERQPGDRGHALTGPVAIRGAMPGDALEVRIDKLQTGGWGWSRVGGRPVPYDIRLGIDQGPELHLNWALDPIVGLAESHLGHLVEIKPFMGVMGMPPAAPGEHSSHPPRRTGGNIDCKELVECSVLLLPIEVEDGLFSVGDGHAAQGDGEVGSTAIECPMSHVELTFSVRRELSVRAPVAHTATEWLAFGFSKNLEQAAFEALNSMTDLLQTRFTLDRKEALAVCSLVVDMRITQMVNGVLGVHAAANLRALATALRVDPEIIRL